MPNIPLPTGITGDQDTPQLQESLVNLYNSGKALQPTPGIDSFSEGTGVCRGIIDFQDQNYQVSGQNLIKIDEFGLITTIGVIEGSTTCVLVKTFNFLVIIVKGGKGYSLSSAGVFEEITSPNFRPSIDVDAINQSFVFVPSDGGVLFYTDVGTLNIGALNLFDAEFLPDKNTGCINLNNDFVVLGEETQETFRDTGDIDAPLQRVDGASVETGYLSARSIYKDTFLFLGRDRGGSYSFFAKGYGDSTKISTSTIDEILNNDYTVQELTDCTSQRFTWSNIDMVAFRLARETFLFFGSGWSRIQTNIDGSDVNSPWDVSFVEFSYGKYITGSAIDEKIGKLSTSNTEFGERIERQIDTYIKLEPNSYLTIDNLFLKVRTGTSLLSQSIGISVSQDGLIYGPTIYRGSGPIGKYAQQVSWQGGCGVFESFCGIRIRTESDIKFALEGLFFNV